MLGVAGPIIGPNEYDHLHSPLQKMPAAIAGGALGDRAGGARHRVSAAHLRRLRAPASRMATYSCRTQ